MSNTDNWIKTSLDNIAKITLGQSPSSKFYNEKGNGLPFFQGKAEFGKFYPSIKKWCFQPKKVAEKGDVLISVRAPIGPTNICPEKSCIGRGLAAIHGLGGIDSKFILYFLRSKEYDISRLGTGTTFKAITGDQIKNLSFLLPPLPEQQRIILKIEELFTKLDAGVEALNNVKAQLERYRQSVLKSAFEGKLTAEWREKHKDQLEPASKFLERIREERKKKGDGKYKEPKPLYTSDLPKLPEGWEWAYIIEIGEVITGTTPSKSKTEYYGKDFPFYKPTDLNEGYYVKKSQDNLSNIGIEKSRLLPSKSILVTCIGATIGKTGFIRKKGASNQQINAIIPYNKIVPEYIYFMCVSPQFQKSILNKSSSTTLPILNKSKFQILPIPIPSKKEQFEIVREIERLFSIKDEIEKLLNKNINYSNILKQSILKKAFSGKLVPQDPTGEPAVKLLERIKEEKQKHERNT